MLMLLVYAFRNASTSIHFKLRSSNLREIMCHEQLHPLVKEWICDHNAGGSLVISCIRHRNEISCQ